MISHSSRFTQKAGTWELCPSPLCPSVYQKQLAMGQKLGLVLPQFHIKASIATSVCMGNIQSIQTII